MKIKNIKRAAAAIRRLIEAAKELAEIEKKNRQRNKAKGGLK